MNWGEDRVMFFDKDAHLRSLPSSWTDVDPPDAFTHTAAGRSWFRTDDLTRLSALIDDMLLDLNQGKKGVK